MPENVSLLIVGGNHTDTTLIQQLHQTVKDLHEQGVPVILAVENSKGVDVDRMIRFTAQHAAELQVLSEGPMEGKTVGERVREKAAQMGVELKDPKPYFPQVVDYNKSDFTYDHRLDPFVARAPTYEAMCELYKFAKKEGITLEGIDRTHEDVQKLEEQGLVIDPYDPASLEPFRIETQSNNLVDLMERMSKGDGGVIITPDLGAGHVASLKTAVDGKVALSQTLQSTEVSVEAIASLQEGLSPDDIEDTMNSSAKYISKMAEHYAKAGIYPEEHLMDLAEKTTTNIKGNNIPIVPSNKIHSYLDPLLKEKLTLQQENVRQLDDHPSGTKIEVEGNSNPGFRPGSVGSEILARGGVVRTQTGEKEHQGRGYTQ